MGAGHILRCDTGDDGVTTVAATSRSELDRAAQAAGAPDWPAWLKRHNDLTTVPLLETGKIGERAAQLLALSFDGAMAAACDLRHDPLHRKDRTMTGNRIVADLRADQSARAPRFTGADRWAIDTVTMRPGLCPVHCRILAWAHLLFQRDQVMRQTVVQLKYREIEAARAAARSYHLGGRGDAA